MIDWLTDYYQGRRSMRSIVAGSPHGSHHDVIDVLDSPGKTTTKKAKMSIDVDMDGGAKDHNISFVGHASGGNSYTLMNFDL